tara:strand:+ start:942 stop:1799 length:858 start_codon:yes stop_codon:yes gene_type:complete
MVDYFGILEQSPEATDSELRKAWIQKCREYHPDKVQHLGTELKTLAAAKTLLLNEAYQALLDPQSKMQHLHQLLRAPQETNGQHRQYRRKSDMPSLSLTAYLEAPLYFLELMRTITPVRELPSSLYFNLDQLNFTLMPSFEDSWVLFTRFPQSFNEIKSLRPGWTHQWNSSLSAGLSYLPGQNLYERTSALNQLLAFFPRNIIDLYLNPGERRGPVYEPNTILLSCLIDCSIPSAQSYWRSLSMNLMSNENEFQMKNDWKARLNQLLPQLFAQIRSRSPEREASA